MGSFHRVAKGVSSDSFVFGVLLNIVQLLSRFREASVLTAASDAHTHTLKSGVVTERFGFGTPASPYRPPLGVKEFGLWIEVSAANAFYRLAKFHVKPSFRLRFLSDILSRFNRQEA